MVKLGKIQPDRFKKIVNDQPGKLQHEDTLGEPAEVTNWKMHIRKGHRLLSYSVIGGDSRNSHKTAYKTVAPDNAYMVAVIVPLRHKGWLFGKRYDQVLILTIRQGTGMIIESTNAGQVGFVEWEKEKGGKK